MKNKFLRKKKQRFSFSSSSNKESTISLILFYKVT